MTEFKREPCYVSLDIYGKRYRRYEGRWYQLDEYWVDGDKDTHYLRPVRESRKMVLDRKLREIVERA